MSRSSQLFARFVTAAAATMTLVVVGAIALAVSGDATDDGGPADPSPSAPPSPELFPVIINRPAGPPTVATGETDHRGEPVTVACATCHTTRDPDASNHATAQLDTFHQGLVVRHGSLSCLACHNRADYDTLQLADGRPVQFVDVMTLCAQCHGPQKRDYDHGSHGGMNGFWDRTRGPRTRNNCIDCHDPHAPAYPRVHPAPGPRDRGVAPHGSGEPHE